ncbi:type VI secretion system membrane subunit TssM [Alcaligenes sp. SDU_A2]|uniref:type VI secretion system membrane subunit TssM n=1 Tax=Alcaligenes sp. SDU_A2 TaxID=3136634 RepID=UPI00311F5AFD
MMRLLNIVFNRSVWTFLGVLVLLVLIWLLGPLLAIGQTRPLESEWARWALMATVLAFWLLRLLWRSWREGRLNAQLLGQLGRSSQKPSAAGSAAPAHPLQSQFDEAIELLKRIRFGSHMGGRLRSLLSRQYVYQLPWYVFIGAPGAGKTTALINSGLQFPLSERYGKTSLRGVGGTRNCDWWFTDEAVLLDTAGRYTTHESDPVGDEQEWRGFLGLLKRYRRRQPINGTLLTISVPDLLASSPEQRHDHAQVLRQRLAELRERLGIQFPIYVLVTKMDLLHGFQEYFERCDRQELEQVWGFTLPYETSRQAGFSLSETYGREYEALRQRLEQGLPAVMAEQPDEALRAEAYLLPQQFARLGPVLEEFLEQVFSQSRFEAPLLLRGVYFTSGRQGGTRLDQVRDPLREYLEVDGQADQSQPAMGQGKSYFLTQLLKELIFQEAGVAGRDERWERRMRLRHFLVYGLAAVAVLALGLAWGRSFWLNRAYVEQVQARVPQAQQQADQTQVMDTTPVAGLQPLLDMLLLLPHSQQFALEAPGLERRMGLYQGEKLKAAADTVYQRALEKLLAPLLARRIETVLRSDQAQDLEYGYEALRAYLMLYDTRRYDAGHLQTWLLGSLKQDLPAGFSQAQYDRLEGHVRAVTQGGLLLNPFPRNEALIEQSRQRLARISLEQRTYSRMRRMLAATPGLRAMSVAGMAGPYAASVFTRQSGKPLTDGVDGLYTYEGYWTVVEPRIDSELQQMRADDRWILGLDTGADQSEAARRAASQELRRLYLLDYVRNWDEYLADLRLVQGASLLENIQLARTLSMADSPLKQLVQQVALQTRLLRDDAAQGASLGTQAKLRLDDTRQALEQMFGPVGLEGGRRTEPQARQVEAIVDQHFEPYHRLASSSGTAPAPIDGTLELLDEFYAFLTSSDAALRSAGTPPQSNVLTKLQAEAGRLPDPLRDALDRFSVGASAEIASRTQESLGQLVNATIGQFCRHAIAGRYPLAGQSSQDVAPNDFARLFAPGGLMDAFFQEHLMHRVDMSGARWRFKPGIDGQAAADFRYLDAFQRAAVIRDVFFPAGSAQPRIDLAVTPVQMDAGLSQVLLDVDGQVLRYAHGPQVASGVQWPGPRGGRQVSLEAQPQSEGSGMRATGAWALLRLLDQAQSVAGASAGAQRLSFSLGGRHFVVDVVANSSKSPWRLAELRGFSCPGSR